METDIPGSRRPNGPAGHICRDDVGTAERPVQGGKNGAVAYEGVFTIDPLASPMQVILVYKTSANPLFLGGPRPGVFQIEADTPKRCFAAVGHSAPKGLTTYPGSESVLPIYQRQPPTATAAVTTTFLHSSPPW